MGSHSELHQADKCRPIRAAHKLTQSHLQPDAFKKMKVRVATQVMSQSTAAGMQMYSEVDEYYHGYFELGAFIMCCT